MTIVHSEYFTCGQSIRNPRCGRKRQEQDKDDKHEMLGALLLAPATTAIAMSTRSGPA